MGALKNDLTANMPKGDIFAFGIDGDSVDKKEVVKFFDFSKGDISKISGVSKTSVRWDDRAPQVVTDHIYQLAIIASLVGEFFDGNAIKTMTWLKMPNPMLGGISPRDMIKLGRSDKLIHFIIRAKEENETAK